MSASVPLSVLELAIVGAGASTADALAATTRVARAADREGYTRIWVAEHHNNAAVASTTPAVLIGHLAAATQHIRVGSGGVLLPNHSPLAVAEQFALLEALHPGRIDLGLGRGTGTDAVAAGALRHGAPAEQDTGRGVLDILALLGDARVDGGIADHVRATPAPRSAPQVALLGSSGHSAQLAGALGLPFAFAHHFGGPTEAAVRLYRSSFRPSRLLDRPHAIVTADVLAAETPEEAERSSLPGRFFHFFLRTGRLQPVPTPEEAARHPQRAVVEEMPTGMLVGDPATVVDGLRGLAAATGADELMLIAHTHAGDERVASLELIAREYGLPRPSDTPASRDQDR
ncbi:LLM class flavin-dependent oxidoreductase [Blastococcus sp. SYSU D00820]